MKKILLILAAIFTWHIATAGVVIPRQEAHYDVSYHWGFVNVAIARGVVTFESDGNRFSGTLDGTSIPWEGKIICVSDTLVANIGNTNGSITENVVYQNGWYRHVPVSLFKSASYNPDDPAYYKNIHGQGNYDASSDSMEAITVTSDMIGMYYLAHALDFGSMEPGHTYNVEISGPFSKQLVIKYEGQGTYTNGGDTYPTYDCSFEYGYGDSLSGFPVECKIGKSSLIPLYFGASLPVGKVEMLYTPQ